MIKTLSYILFASTALIYGCTKKEQPIIEVDQNSIKEVTDSFAIKDIRFGVDQQAILQDSTTQFIENRITEPSFGKIVTELESHITIDTHQFKAYYYFSPKNSLYKLVLIKNTGLDLRKYPHDGFNDSYKSLYQTFKNQYGNGTRMDSKLKHSKLIWDLKNKNIILEKFAFEGTGTIECTITEKNIFRKFAKNTTHFQATIQFEKWKNKYSLL